MRRAGLGVSFDRFTVFGSSLSDPAYAGSRNVVGVWDGAGRCLVVLMGHPASVTSGPGAVDNGSGPGVASALGTGLRRLRPFCDVWLVATGAEERVVKH